MTNPHAADYRRAVSIIRQRALADPGGILAAAADARVTDIRGGDA